MASDYGRASRGQWWKDDGVLSWGRSANPNSAISSFIELFDICHANSLKKKLSENLEQLRCRNLTCLELICQGEVIESPF
jgi:hypothetical protein